MILDIEQREKDIIISYYDKEGKVAFKSYPIQEYKNWYVCKPTDKGASSSFKNWDGRSVRQSKSRNYNKFSLLYFLESLPERDKAILFEYNKPKKYFVDIETEIVDGFPKAEEAKSRILTFSIITPDKKAIVLGLEDLDNKQIQKIEDDMNEYLVDFEDKWEFKYHKFKSEYDMVYTFLMKFVPKFPMMTGWNFVNYDWQYITNRCKRLQIDIKEVGMTGALDYNGSRPLHTGILDYMQLYDKYDKSVKVKESNALDYVASQVLGVKKIKYTGGLQELYENDFLKYVYYNAVDSVLVHYIDKKLKSMDVLLTLAHMTKMPLYKAASPVGVTESLIARKLLGSNKRVGAEARSEESKDGQYAGAFVKEPRVGYYEGVSAFDFASLYPSIMRQFNISPDSYLGQIPVKDVPEKRKDKSIIVCENGATYSTEDSMLKNILADLYRQRKEYKQTSYEYYTKALELQKLLK